MKKEKQKNKSHPEITAICYEAGHNFQIELFHDFYDDWGQNKEND
ncbi:MAG TPA: hypothetical protein PLJ49_08635 [Smithella sp.]|nr:hypothetical protein [Smithella sp.]HOX99253.1 hypothetical protein [Smithella sp.]